MEEGWNVDGSLRIDDCIDALAAALAKDQPELAQEFCA